jgi:predicted RNA-binding protein with PIN domain
LSVGFESLRQAREKEKNTTHVMIARRWHNILGFTKEFVKGPYLAIWAIGGALLPSNFEALRRVIILSMRWLVDGYNVIRRSPDLAPEERLSLEAGRQALCRLLAVVAQASGDQFTVVFDGSGAGSASSGGPGVRVLFSSARERADQVLGRLAAQGGAVVSNDREVRRAAQQAGAISISTDDFLARVTPVHPMAPRAETMDKDEEEEPSRRPKKGNPHRLSKKDRAASRALNRLGPGGRGR